MNYFKWLICWYNKKHIFSNFYDKHGNGKFKCVRCGYEVQ